MSIGTWLGFSSSGVSGWESLAGEFKDMLDANESSRSRSTSGALELAFSLRTGATGATGASRLVLLPPRKDGTARWVLNLELLRKDMRN